MAQETVKIPYTNLRDLGDVIDILVKGKAISQKGPVAVVNNKSQTRYTASDPRFGNLEIVVAEGGAGEDIEVTMSGDDDSVELLADVLRDTCT
ncbi:MAG: hypothetical protein U9Q03_02130 [Patescibacteria group bacterium]|nr:hypothetical protein [Patescibacteria group bacterium]